MKKLRKEIISALINEKTIHLNLSLSLSYRYSIRIFHSFSKSLFLSMSLRIFRAHYFILPVYVHPFSKRFGIHTSNLF